jgi:hypothetical protein
MTDEKGNPTGALGKSRSLLLFITGCHEHLPSEGSSPFQPGYLPRFQTDINRKRLLFSFAALTVLNQATSEAGKKQNDN